MTETANTDTHAPAGSGVVWSGRHVRIELDAERPRVATLRIDRPKLNPLWVLGMAGMVAVVVG